MYTAKELERVVLRRISSEICWASRMPTTICPIPERGPGGVSTSDIIVHLVEGGRWLLTISRKHGATRVLAYDLDKPFPQDAQCIIELKPSNPEPYWFINTDVDLTEAILTFNLALIPDSTFIQPGSDDSMPLPEIHIYHVRLEGHGNQAKLEAHKIKSLQSSRKQFTTSQCFYGDHFARASEEISSRRMYIEVCNWSLSDSSVEVVSFIFLSRLFPTHMMLLPDNNFVAIFRDRIEVYDITNLHLAQDSKTECELSLQPYWTYSNTLMPTIVQISKPYCDQNVARISVGTMNGIFGLTVPLSDIYGFPSYKQISNLELSPLSRCCLGLNKIHYQIQPGVIVVGNYTWPDDCNISRDDTLLPIPADDPKEWKFPYEWQSDPLFDERSNRLLSLTNEFWVLVDFAPLALIGP